MAYTTSQAITALNRYLNITESEKQNIPGTKNRGFVYKTQDGQRAVIFVYPLVHKQDNTKNYFDTRDSGAYERSIAWEYSLKHNFKYFCFGINDSVDKYVDYIFSLECDEKTIERISGTKYGARNGPGNQIIIPNDYVPKKPFERIQNKLGIFIAAVNKSELKSYIQSYDNRPYMGAIESPSLDTSLNDEPKNEYERAAIVLKNHLETKDISFLTEKTDIEKTRDEFMSRFSPEKLAALSGHELLTKIFYTVGDNTESLCCWIEMNKECRKHFGSIAGGSAYKFGLFQKKDNEMWVTGGPMKSKDLTVDEALDLGTRIRDALVKGASIIRNTVLNTVDDYEKLDDTLKANISDQNIYYNWAWFHKYFSILFPEKLSSYHSNDWQYHILRALRIKPSEKLYARSGQIAMVQQYGGWWYRQLADIAYDKFGGIKQFYRLGSSDNSKGYASEWKNDSVVAIGWPELGTLENYKDEDGSLDKSEISSKLQEIYYPNDSKTASRKAGELIRFYESNKDSIFVVADGEKLIGMVDDLGTYRYDDSTNMANIKPGIWHCPFSDEEKLPEKSEGLMTSCVQIKNEENLMYLYTKYYYEDNNDSEEDQKDNVTMKTCLEIERKPRSDRSFPLNAILYGAPGTGKTYSTAEYALRITRTPIPNDRKEVMKAYNDLIRKGQIVFTTFHQNYGYEEFIQGLRLDKNSDTMSFKIVDGIFKTIADRALNDENNNYVIIIDEINRANISKVFGELITLIEEDKRWGELNETSATLQSGDPFAVPNNLYIIGTMNSADKSISLIDAALRRRFDFIEQKPDSTLVPEGVLRTMFDEINSSLVQQLDSTDLLVGHSYFMNKSEKDLCGILNNNIIPLLYEYFYDDRKKVASLLKNAIDKSGAMIEIVDEKVGRLSVKDRG